MLCIFYCLYKYIIIYINAIIYSKVAIFISQNISFYGKINYENWEY